MSQQDPVVPGQPANTPPPVTSPEEKTAERQADRPARGSAEDPLRGSAAGHVWIILVLMVVVLVLLAVFILQNLESVQVNYFGATGSSPLAVALLLAFAAGLAVAGLAGTARILQLRRRVKKADR